MLIVETIRKIRLSVHRDGKSLRKTAEDLNLSRNTVRKVIRSEETAFTYKRKKQPMPKLGEFVEKLAGKLERDKKLPKRQRRTAQKLFQELQLMGYEATHSPRMNDQRIPQFLEPSGGQNGRLAVFHHVGEQRRGKR